MLPRLAGAGAAFALALGLWGADASAQAPCGGETACEIDDGSYHLVLPEGWDGAAPLPAIMFFHGFRSSGRSVLRGSVMNVFGAAGYAVIAPNGQTRPETDIRFWPARPVEGELRDDVAFADAVVDDVARRIPLDRGRVLVGGFSAGGSMAWLIACREGGAFAAYVSVAGALRRPAPEGACPGGPAPMLHFHGYADRQVPLEGRGIRDWHQGDAFESLSLLRATNGCKSRPDEVEIGERFWCRAWTGCESGDEIRFCLHAGGHGLPKGWAAMAREWFEGLPPG